MVPCTVKKTVKVCVPYDVCVRKCRYVPYTVCDAAPHDPCCGKAKACEPCAKPCCQPCAKAACAPACQNQCQAECCDPCARRRPGLLARFFHRRMCCEPAHCGCCN